MTDCGCTNFPASLGNVTFGASVGVGTTSPIAPLDVESAAAPQVVVRGGTTTSLRLFPTGGSISSVEAFATTDVTATNYSRLRLTVDGVTAGVIADAAGTGTPMPIALSAGGAERLRIATSGNVGIGTSAPAAALHVKLDTANVLALVDTATAAESSQLALGEAGQLIWQIYKPANSHDLRFFRSNKGDQVTIQDGTGNVGIGTSSPGYPLDVAGTVRCTGVLLGGDQLMSGALKDSTGNVTHVDAGGCYYAS